MKISKDNLEKIQLQFELDCNLFDAEKVNDNILIAPTKVLPGSRVINGLDPFFRVIIFLGKAYIMADEETVPGFMELFKDSDPNWFFNYGHLRKIDYILKEFDREIVDTHIYYLPDEDARLVPKCSDFKWFNEEDIKAYKDKNAFCHALCYSPTQPDRIAVYYEENNKILGMAGASLDGKYTYQIGIDILEEARRKGLSVRLVTELKQELLKQDILPFYGTSESHALSRMVAVKSGFLPAFSELFVAKK